MPIPSKLIKSHVINYAHAWLAILFLSLASLMQAQESILSCPDSLYCIPSVRGLPRGKGLVVSKESSLNQRIRTTQPGTEGANSDELIDQNSRYSFKLKLPIMNKDNFKMVLGGVYTTEKFAFENSELLMDPLLVELQKKPLQTIGADLYLLKPFIGDKYALVRIQSRLNGDYTASQFKTQDFLRVSIVGGIGWKIHEDRALGIGAAYSYIFGRASILPVLLYYDNINERWGFEGNLPANFRFRYTPNESRNFYAGMEIKGANYKLAPSDISSPYFLEKSEIRSSFTYEQEIHDWLWVGLSLGHRYTYSMDVSAVNNLSLRTGDPLLDATLDNTFYYNLSIFIVPPRKMLQMK